MIESKLQQFGLRFSRSYKIKLRKGVTIESNYHIEGVGGPMGMLIFSDYEPISDYVEELGQLGFGYTVFSDTQADDNINLDDFRAMLRDWGWDNN